MIIPLGLFILFHGCLAIFFNLTTIPGLGGKSPQYFEDPNFGHIVGTIECVIAIIILIYGIIKKNKNIKTDILEDLD